jgi:hypothetical protein
VIVEFPPAEPSGVKASPLSAVWVARVPPTPTVRANALPVFPFRLTVASYIEPEPPPLPPSAPPPPPPAITSVLKDLTPTGAVQVLLPTAVNLRKHLPPLSDTDTPVVLVTAT